MEMFTFGPGTIVGPYRIVKQIGSGGMGAVYEAAHLVLRRRAAVKVLHAHLRGKAGLDARMIQEASILEDLCHPGITRIYDCAVLADGRPWIAMELVPGESLAVRMAREVRIPPADLCKLMASIADVLATVHVRGIVHRDLKPDNILFAEVHTGFPLRIIDWGVARLGPSARLTQDGVTCGTPIYMSPEQCAGKNIAPACDIYSLGIMAYEALCGHPPFEGDNLAEVVKLHLHGAAAPLASKCPTAPPKLCELVHQMLHKVPTMRPTASTVSLRMTELARSITDARLDFAAFELEEPASEFASFEITDGAPQPVRAAKFGPSQTLDQILTESSDSDTTAKWGPGPGGQDRKPERSASSSTTRSTRTSAQVEKLSR